MRAINSKTLHLGMIVFSLHFSYSILREESYITACDTKEHWANLLFEQAGPVCPGTAQHPPHVIQLSLQLHTARLCSSQVGDQHCREEQ